MAVALIGNVPTVPAEPGVLVGRRPPTVPRIDPASLNMKEQTVLVDDSLDDGGWAPGRHWNDFHVGALFAIIHSNAELERLKVYYEPDLSAEKQRQQWTVGVFAATFGYWHLVLNWTPEMKGHIPPRHILCEALGTQVGILGPHLRRRWCWSCGLNGFRDRERTQPWVVPGRPCPRCGQKDWTGIVITPWHLQRDCAEHVARRTNFDPYYSAFDGDRAEIWIRRELKGNTEA